MAKEPFTNGTTVLYCPSVSPCYQSFEMSAVVGGDNLTCNCVVCDVLKHYFVPFGAFRCRSFPFVTILYHILADLSIDFYFCLQFVYILLYFTNSINRAIVFGCCIGFAVVFKGSKSNKLSSHSLEIFILDYFSIGA